MFRSVHVASEGEAEALVLGIFQDRRALPEMFPEARPALQAALARRECTAEKENLVETFLLEEGREIRILLPGLGQSAALRPGDFRDLAATIGRRLAQARVHTVHVALDPQAREAGLDVSACGRAFGEGMGLLAWEGNTFRGSATRSRTSDPLTLFVPDEAFRSGVEYGLKLAAAVNLARDLSQTPPNVATPLWIAERAEQVARQSDLRCRILQGEELKTERMEGLLHVGRASVNPPCLIRLEYRPERGTTRSPIVFVGKTITYDTGGLSIKSRENMVGMKRDKDGGCAVLGAMQAIGTLIRPDFPVIGLLAAAENSIGAASMRPDDVLTYRNGVTVEVTNTDAEGRLVLADALCWACDVEKPALIVDLATLTGGVVVALGSVYAGLFCEDEPLLARLERAAEVSGERVWRLPLHEEYRELMKSPVADLVNSNPGRKAHPIQGAAFLAHFVEQGIPWAHIDIAGVHAVDADRGPFVKGPTGYGVRLLAELVHGLQKEGIWQD